jgi:hypothetical protein
MYERVTLPIGPHKGLPNKEEDQLKEVKDDSDQSGLSFFTKLLSSNPIFDLAKNLRSDDILLGLLIFLFLKEDIEDHFIIIILAIILLT